MKSNMKKKLLGAIIPGIIIIAYLALVLFVVIFSQMSAVEKMPVGVFIYLLIALCIPFIGIIAALFLRIREIENGEEEEAKKY